MNRVFTVRFINDFIFFDGVVIRMDVNHADVVVQCGRFSMALHEKPKHGVVAMRIPPRQKNDMFPIVVHGYLISMTSALGCADSLYVKKSDGSFWLVTNLLMT